MNYSILSFLLFSFVSYSQSLITGSVYDTKTNESIPFCSIGLLNQNNTSLANEGGSFTLTIVNSNMLDTLKFYAIGYKELKITFSSINLNKNLDVYLEPDGLSLDEIEISAKKYYELKLGVTKYDKKNCSGFMSESENWKGVETAIRIPNKESRLIKVKDFSFYIIKNTLKDSLTFRLNFYSANNYYPTRNILKKSIIFKTDIKSGEYKLNLLDYNISAYADFYVSLECLMDSVSIRDFCFAGENTEPAFIRENAFKKWRKVKGGGGGFNLTVLYSK